MVHQSCLFCGAGAGDCVPVSFIYRVYSPWNILIIIKKIVYFITVTYILFQTLFWFHLLTEVFYGFILVISISQFVTVLDKLGFR